MVTLQGIAIYAGVSAAAAGIAAYAGRDKYYSFFRRTPNRRRMAAVLHGVCMLAAVVAAGEVTQGRLCDSFAGELGKKPKACVSLSAGAIKGLFAAAYRRERARLATIGGRAEAAEVPDADAPTNPDGNAIKDIRRECEQGRAELLARDKMLEKRFGKHNGSESLPCGR